MYQISEISCLAETIAIKGSVGTDYEQLSDSLAPATAVVTVNDVHPLITPENISSCFRSADTMGINAWSNSVAYLKNQRVSHSGKYYRAKIDGINQNPTSQTTYWEEISLISTALSEIVDSACNKMLRKLFQIKQLNQTVKTILDDFFLFTGKADSTNLNANLNRLVGFVITPKNASDISVVLKQISLQFIGNFSNLEIHLYHSSKTTPVHTITVDSYNDNGSVKWITANKILNYISSTTDPGGCWYLVYSESNINAAQSLKKDTNYVVNPGCASCDYAYYQQYTKRSKYIDVQPFYVNQGNYTNGELWDIANEIYVDNNNFGLNFSMTAQCDLSNFICRNKEHFADALAYQVGIDILNEFCSSTRNNQLADKIKSEAYFALNGDRNTMYSGLNKEYDNALKTLSFDISSINNVCLPCENKKKISYRAI